MSERDERRFCRDCNAIVETTHEFVEHKAIFDMTDSELVAELRWGGPAAAAEAMFIEQSRREARA